MQHIGMSDKLWPCRACSSMTVQMNTLQLPCTIDMQLYGAAVQSGTIGHTSPKSPTTIMTSCLRPRPGGQQIPGHWRLSQSLRLQAAGKARHGEDEPVAAGLSSHPPTSGMPATVMASTEMAQQKMEAGHMDMQQLQQTRAATHQPRGWQKQPGQALGDSTSNEGRHFPECFSLAGLAPSQNEPVAAGPSSHPPTSGMDETVRARSSDLMLRPSWFELMSAKRSSRSSSSSSSGSSGSCRAVSYTHLTLPTNREV